MPLKKGYKKLLEEAGREIRELTVAQAVGRLGDARVVFVDLRDVRELEREGMIPNAFHAPRGMLEFWVDPESPYYKPVFGEDKEFILYCQSGWRSALAAKTLQDMGFAPVCHIQGGFRAWKESGGPVGERPSHKG
jgi:rhodanese-related sulfurtransferase